MRPMIDENRGYEWTTLHSLEWHLDKYFEKHNKPLNELDRDILKRFENFLELKMSIIRGDNIETPEGYYIYDQKLDEYLVKEKQADIETNNDIKLVFNTVADLKRPVKKILENKYIFPEELTELKQFMKYLN